MTPGTLDKLEAAYEAHCAYVLGALRPPLGVHPTTGPGGRLSRRFCPGLEKTGDGRLDVAAMSDRQLRAYLAKTGDLMALDQVRWGERAHTRPLTDPDPDLERTSADEPAEDRVADSSELAVVHEIVAELPDRRRAIFISEIDAHRGTLRALRLPEPPPVMRRTLRGCRSAALEPEQVPSLVPAAFLKG
jgi:hypothetical protein